MLLFREVVPIRLQRRNLKTVWYALYEGQTEITETDEWGNTIGLGETKIRYGKPVSIKGNVSPASGKAQTEIFGTELNYSRVLIVDDMDCPIDENSLLWITKDPEYDTDGNPLPEYIVVERADSPHSISFALKRREVS